MRIHLLAMLALLTAAVATGCDSPREVRDTGRANIHGCDSCHGYPPPPSFNPDLVHPTGLTASTCTVCHPTTVAADGHTILVDTSTGTPRSTHKNGDVDAIQPPYFDQISCEGCHALPPDTGLHVFHAENQGVACGTCHRGFDVGGDGAPRSADASVHMNGRIDVLLDDDAGTEIPAANLPDGSWAPTSCRPCHDALGVSAD